MPSSRLLAKWAAAALTSPLESEQHGARGTRAILVHHTRQSGLRMAAEMDHVVEGPDGTVTASESEPDLARIMVSTELAPGQTLTVVKLMAYGWSAQRSMPALRSAIMACP